MLSIITNVMHARIDKVCEAKLLKGTIGKVEYGFRSERSTSNCVFILLSAIRKAKT